MPKRKPAPELETFEVTVWDYEGDIVKKLWEATDDDLADVEDRYGDDPRYTIVVERR